MLTNLPKAIEDIIINYKKDLDAFENTDVIKYFLDNIIVINTPASIRLEINNLVFEIPNTHLVYPTIGNMIDYLLSNWYRFQLYGSKDKFVNKWIVYRSANLAKLNVMWTRLENIYIFVQEILKDEPNINQERFFEYVQVEEQPRQHFPFF
jgi:hypothetical protein